MTTIRMFTLALLFVLAAQTAQAASLNDAVKYFEQARRLEVSGLPDKAAPYWRRAADEFQALLGSDNRQAGWASNRAMAGMSFFFDGRYEQADLALAPLVKSGDKVPEAYSYGGLALAMLGDKAGAVNAWKKYPLGYGQRVVARVLKEQVAALEKGGSLDAAATAVRDALRRQARLNISLKPSPVGMSPSEQCSGAFWWRYNTSRCPMGSIVPPP